MGRLHSNQSNSKVYTLLANKDIKNCTYLLETENSYKT